MVVRQTRALRRSAFTLVELLVVISIIGVLMALLLPAVNAARASMWKAECANNLKQLTTAMTNWSSAKAMRLPGYAEPVGGKRMPWPVAMMPYMEEQQLYDQYRSATLLQVIPPSYDGSNFTEPLRPNFICAADGEKGGQEGPQMSYVANVGMALTFPLAAPTPSTPLPVFKANGVFQSAEANAVAGLPETTLNLAGVADGTAYTVAFSENVQATTYGLPENYDPTDATEESRFRLAAGFHWFQTPASNVGINKPSPLFKQPGALNVYTDPAFARPSSFHAGGVNMGFVDGHIQFMPEMIDPITYMQLMTPNGLKSDMPAAYRDTAIPWDEIN